MGKGKVAPTNHRITSATFEQEYFLKFDTLGRSIEVVAVSGFEMCEHDSLREERARATSYDAERLARETLLI